jgi:hypothetical protein
LGFRARSILGSTSIEEGEVIVWRPLLERSVLILLVLSMAKAACPARSTTADLSAAVVKAQSIYVAMDQDGFNAARAQADALLPCLGELLGPEDAAAYHRLHGLDAYLAEDRLRTLSAFRAAVAIQPGFVLPSTLAPVGNPLYAVYQEARGQPPGAVEPLTVPTGALAHVDGLRTLSRPMEREAVLQVSASSGEILWTALLPAGAPAPNWEAIVPGVSAGATSAAVPPPNEAPPVEGPRPRRLTLGVAIGAGGAALASGVLYGLATASRARFDDPATSYEDVEGLRSRTNAQVVASAGAGVVALGLGSVALVSLRW